MSAWAESRSTLANGNPQKPIGGMSPFSVSFWQAPKSGQSSANHILINKAVAVQLNCYRHDEMKSPDLGRMNSVRGSRDLQCDLDGDGWP